LGANIGTTITAMLAGLATSSTAAVTVALVHLLFNVFGSALVYPFRKYPIHMSRSLTQLSLKNRALPIAYIISIFYILPFVLIFVIRWF